MELRIDQLKDFQLWKTANSENFSLGDYLFGVSNLETAIVFTKLFWADFLNHEGGIFLADGFTVENYEKWKEELDGDIKSIEKIINLRYVADLLPDADDISRNNLIYFGQTLADIWESKLTKTFPEKLFLVECDFDKDDLESEITVTLSQVRE